jgi:hypothetical protein
MTVGDIGVSPSWVVTPNGTAPLMGSTWIVRDMHHERESIPTYAIVLAVVFAVACLLGLLFLLIKERTYSGYVEVQVWSADLTHLTQVPVQGPNDVAYVQAQVAHAQALAGSV